MADTSYTIVPQEAVAGNTTALQALHNGGWNCASSFREHWKKQLVKTENGTYLSDPRAVLTARFPVAFHGVYRIQLTVHAAQGDIADMAVFSGRRQSIARGVRVTAGQTWKKAWYAVVAPYIPAFTAKKEDECALYISVTGKNAGISEISVEPASVPVLWVAGDSTLTDQNALFPYYGLKSCGGWAQALPRYLDGMTVCNYAHSGMTTNCFRDDGHWSLIQHYAKPGDAVLFQFGHNDQKRRNLAAFGGYSINLRRYVREARSLGLIPVIASPISRIPFEDNALPRSLLASHALAAELVAEELSVPFINLHELTFAHWVAAGNAASSYFMPGDATHTNDYGADFIASLVSNEIQQKRIEPLCSHLVHDLSPFVCTDGDALPPPEAQTGSIFDIPLPYVDAGRGKTRRAIEAAFRAGLLDPCVLHVHPHDSLPRAQLLMLFFKASRMSGVRPYSDTFDDIARYEWDAGYVQACLNGNLISAPACTDCAASGSLSTPALFHPDEPVTAGFFATLCVRVLEEDTAQRLSLSEDVCVTRAQELQLLPAGCKKQRKLSRAQCYGALARLSSLIAGDAARKADHPVV